MNTAVATQQSIFVESTDKEAYAVLTNELPKLKAIFEAKGIKFNDLDELRRVHMLGLLLGIPNPTEKFNELYSLVNAEWSYLESIGTLRDFTPNLSYRAICYILRVYKVLPNLTTTKVTQGEGVVSLDEVKAMNTLLANKARIEESLKWSLSLDKYTVHKLKSFRMLTRILDTSYYQLTKVAIEYSSQLTKLGCSYVKNKGHQLSYRGVVFLLLKMKYPLSSSQPAPQVTPVSIPNVVPKLEPIAMETVVEYIRAKKTEAEKLARLQAEKAQGSKKQLAILDEALLLAEQAQELLQEAGV